MYSPADAALEHARGAGEEPDLVDHRRDLLARGQRPAACRCSRASSLTSSSARVLDGVGDLQQRLLALARGGVPPALERLGRGGVGPVDVLGRRTTGACGHDLRRWSGRRGRSCGRRPGRRARRRRSCAAVRVAVLTEAPWSGCRFEPMTDSSRDPAGIDSHRTDARAWIQSSNAPLTTDSLAKRHAVRDRIARVSPRDHGTGADPRRRLQARSSSSCRRTAAGRTPRSARRSACPRPPSASGCSGCSTPASCRSSRSPTRCRSASAARR